MENIFWIGRNGKLITNSTQLNEVSFKPTGEDFILPHTIAERVMQKLEIDVNGLLDLMGVEDGRPPETED